MIINQTIENISENIGWVLFKLDAEHYEQQVWLSSSTYCICSKSNIFCSMQLGTGNKSVDMATSQWLSFCALLSDVHYCRCQVIHYSRVCLWLHQFFNKNLSILEMGEDIPKQKTPFIIIFKGLWNKQKIFFYFIGTLNYLKICTGWLKN